MKRNMTKLICAILCLLALAACQKTPENEFIASKKDAEIIETIEPDKGIDSVEQANFPEVYMESVSFYNDKLVLNINAGLDFCEKEYCIYEVYQDRFEEGMIENIVEYFCGNRAILSGLQAKSKEELEEQLLEFKADIASGATDLSEEEQADTIAWLIERINNAPKEVEKTYVDLFADQVNGVIDFESGTSGELMIDNFAGIFLLNNGNGYYETKQTERRGTQKDLDSEIIYVSDTMISPIEETINKDESIKKANDFLEEIGVNGFGFRQIEVGTKIDDETGKWSDESLCYNIYFTRDIDGIPITYDRNSVNSKFSYSWNYEYIKISVNESGIFEFNWHGKSTIGDKVYSNVSLLGFEEIKNYFINGIKAKRSYFEESDNIINSTINITEIRLGYMKTQKKDENGAYILIPVWDFFGNAVGKSKNRDGTIGVSEIDRISVRYSFLTINAMDGSIIDRSSGY